MSYEIIFAYESSLRTVRILSRYEEGHVPMKCPICGQELRTRKKGSELSFML